MQGVHVKVAVKSWSYTRGDAKARKRHLPLASWQASPDVPKLSLNFSAPRFIT